MTTDATKLPDMECVRRAVAAEIVARNRRTHMDAQAGRTAAPMVTEEALRKWSDDITQVLHRYNSTRISAGAAWAFHNYAEPTIERVVAEMRAAALTAQPAAPMVTEVVYNAYWRETSDGLQLSCPDGCGWWVAIVSRSEIQPGKWRWKLAGIRGDRYCETREQAMEECTQAVLRGDAGERYAIKTVAEIKRDREAAALAKQPRDATSGGEAVVSHNYHKHAMGARATPTDPYAAPGGIEGLLDAACAAFYGKVWELGGDRAVAREAMRPVLTAILDKLRRDATSGEGT